MSSRYPPTAIRGSIAPLVTPFTDSGEVDHPGLRRMVRWQLQAGSHGISIGGSTGEPSSQTLAERAAAIRTVAGEVAGRVPFLPGTGSAKLDETLELTTLARDAGADLALVITPYYARPTQEALFQWYATVCREVPDLPIACYNVPSRTAVDISPEVVGRLFRAFDNFAGIKETTKDFEHFSRVKYAARDIVMWSGIELLCLPVLSIGGSGFVSALANIAPEAVAQLYTAARDGQTERALELHYRLMPLVDALFVETNPAPAKWVLAQAGLIDSDAVRSPLLALSPPGQQRVRQLLRQPADLLTPVDRAALDAAATAPDDAAPGNPAEPGTPAVALAGAAREDPR